MASTVCVRCGEELVDRLRPCGFCDGERLREAVTTLVATANVGGDAALLQRVNAIETLQNLGYSQTAVLQARAGALDGYSVEQILDGLEGEREAVAA